MPARRADISPSKFAPQVGSALPFSAGAFCLILWLFSLIWVPTHAAAANNAAIQQAFNIGATGNTNPPQPDLRLDIHSAQGTLILTANDEKLTCHLCSAQMILHTARTLGTLTYTNAHKVKPVTLTLTGVSSASPVWIDGLRLPTHIRKLAVTPQHHTIVMRQNGVTGTLRLNANAATHIRLSPEDFSFQHLHPKMLRAGVLIMAMGAALSAVGAAFVMLHNEPATNEVYADDEYVYEHRLKAPGIAISAVGVAMIGTGIGILFYRRKLLQKAKETFLKGGR